jgi:Fe-S oxidoreductase
LQRVDEARTAGAEILITACQHCRQNLTRWQEDGPMPVVDLVDLVYEAAGLSGSALDALPGSE